MSLISIVEYMHDLKEAGFTDKQSEVQARRLEWVIADVKSELKQDIKHEFHKLRDEMLKFTIWTGVAVVMAIAGMLAKGFHWF